MDWMVHCMALRALSGRICEALVRIWTITRTEMEFVDVLWYFYNYIKWLSKV